jgi:hypothetical protein
MYWAAVPQAEMQDGRTHWTHNTREAMYLQNATLGRVRVTVVHVKEQITITYFPFVLVALVTQDEMCICRVILSPVVYSY